MTRLARLLFSLTILLVAVAAHAAPKRRSVIVVVVDSLRADHLQTYGYTRPTSPNLLRFSTRATVFTRAYAASAWTRPSVMSLMTGEYPSELNSNHGGGIPLRDGHRTLATVLRSHGYRTGGFYNSAQLTPELANMQHGFDEYVDYGSADREPYHAAFVGRGVDQAIDFLDGSSKPAFLFLHILDPHFPYEPAVNRFGTAPRGKFLNSTEWATPAPAPGECNRDRTTMCYFEKDKSATKEMVDLYDSEIVEVDTQLARLFAFIEKDRRYRDALVVVTADHGEEFGEHGGLYHSARFYEETLHIPLIIRDPARPHSIGRRVDALAAHVDLAPTILQALGLPVGLNDYSGRSLVEYLARRGGRPRETVYMEKPGCACSGMVVVRHGDWKMFFPLMHTNLELYNLRTDPREKTNLIASNDPKARAAATQLTSLYQTWHRHVTRPLSSRSGGTEPEIPAGLRERLKALGYLQ